MNIWVVLIVVSVVSFEAYAESAESSQEFKLNDDKLAKKFGKVVEILKKQSKTHEKLTKNETYLIEELISLLDNLFEDCKSNKEDDMCENISRAKDMMEKMKDNNGEYDEESNKNARKILIEILEFIEKGNNQSNNENQWDVIAEKVARILERQGKSRQNLTDNEINVVKAFVSELKVERKRCKSENKDGNDQVCQMSFVVMDVLEAIIENDGRYDEVTNRNSKEILQKLRELQRDDSNPGKNDINNELYKKLDEVTETLKTQQKTHRNLIRSEIRTIERLILLLRTTNDGCNSENVDKKEKEDDKICVKLINSLEEIINSNGQYDKKTKNTIEILTKLKESLGKTDEYDHDIHVDYDELNKVITAVVPILKKQQETHKKLLKSETNVIEELISLLNNLIEDCKSNKEDDLCDYISEAKGILEKVKYNREYDEETNKNATEILIEIQESLEKVDNQNNDENKWMIISEKVTLILAKQVQSRQNLTENEIRVLKAFVSELKAEKKRCKPKNKDENEICQLYLVVIDICEAIIEKNGRYDAATNKNLREILKILRELHKDDSSVEKNDINSLDHDEFYRKFDEVAETLKTQQKTHRNLIRSEIRTIERLILLLRTTNDECYSKKGNKKEEEHGKICESTLELKDSLQEIINSKGQYDEKTSKTIEILRRIKEFLGKTDQNNHDNTDMKGFTKTLLEIEKLLKQSLSNNSKLDSTELSKLISSILPTLSHLRKTCGVAVKREYHIFCEISQKVYEGLQRKLKDNNRTKNNKEDLVLYKNIAQLTKILEREENNNHKKSIS